MTFAVSLTGTKLVHATSHFSEGSSVPYRPYALSYQSEILWEGRWDQGGLLVFSEGRCQIKDKGFDLGWNLCTTNRTHRPVCYTIGLSPIASAFGDRTKFI